MYLFACSIFYSVKLYIYNRGTLDESSNKQRLIINANASHKFTIKYWPVLVLKSTLVIKKFQRQSGISEEFADVKRKRITQSKR